MAAATTAGVGFAPAIIPVSSQGNYAGKLIKLRVSSQSSRPFSVSRQNPCSALPRGGKNHNFPLGLRIARVAAVATRPPNWSFAISGSLIGDSGTNPEYKSKDLEEVASVDIKLPRRSLLVQFTCNSCGEKTKRLINRLAYEKGLVFVQCAGCLRHHKLVDNLGLIVEHDFRESSKDSSMDHV